jgi:hypothetical protein
MASASRREPPRFAEPGDIEHAAEQWSESVLECRDTGHHWERARASHIRRLHYYTVIHICSRCGMFRTREMSESGHVYANSYTYPDGYLLKGLGRIAGEAKDAIRALALTRATDVTEVRGRAKDEDLPRFKATRDAIDESE